MADDEGKNDKDESAEDIVQDVKDNLRLVWEAESAQRIRERDDLQFQVPEYQWDEAARRSRQGDTATGSLPRPMLSVSLLQQPMRLIQNQAANAHLGIKIHPVSEDASSEQADVLQGLYRRIERDSHADQARLWALDRAKQCGRGWYRIVTRFDEDSPSDPDHVETWDQEIGIQRILYQERVYIDPSAEEPDFSDAEWAIIATYVPKEEFFDLYPDAQTPVEDQSFQGGAEEPRWVRGEGDQQAYLVAEYFYKVHDRRSVTGKNGVERMIDRVTVKWCHLTSVEVLKATDWMGHYIPLVPVIGVELQPFNSERRWEGMVRPARDGQKFFNLAVSSAVERMNMEPKAPWVMAEGQDEGHEDEFKLSNVRNLPVLHYSPKTAGGQVIGPPQRAQIDTTGTSLAFMAMDQAKALVQSATAIFNPSLGDLSEKDRSGKAIQALQQQADAGSSNYLWNLANISMRYEAKCVLDLMPVIYDRAGRITQILGEEGDEKTVMLNQPFVSDREGNPRPATGPMGMLRGMMGNVKHYDLAKGRYSISVDVGKSYQTRLDEGSAEIGDILAQAPNLLPVIGDLYFKFRQFPGAHEIAERLAKWREKQFPGIGDEEENGPSPEQLQGQLQQQGQQMQMMQAQLQGAMQKLETDQAKQQATLQKTAMEIESAEKIAAANNQTKLAIADVSERINAVLELVKLSHGQLQAKTEMAHAEVQAQTQRIHDVATMAGEHAHEAAMTEAAQAHEQAQSQSGMAHEAAMQAATPKPEPSEAE